MTSIRFAHLEAQLAIHEALETLSKRACRAFLKQTAPLPRQAATARFDVNDRDRAIVDSYPLHMERTDRDIYHQSASNRPSSSF